MRPPRDAIRRGFYATNAAGATADYSCALYIGPRIAMAIPDDEIPTGSDGALDAWLDLMASLNIRTIRTDLRWSSVELSSGVDTWPTKYSRLKARCAAKGFKLIPVVHRTPTFHRLSGVTQAGGPSVPAAYAAFCVRMIAYFGASIIEGVEIWNEVNQATTTTGDGFWQTGRPVSELAAMHVAAYDAIKAAYPSMPVCSNGLSSIPKPGAAKYYPAEDSLKALFDNGLLGKTDAIGYHPYWNGDSPLWGASESWSGPSILKNDLLPLATARGGGSLPFWMTEIGAPTSGTGDAISFFGCRVAGASRGR